MYNTSVQKGAWQSPSGVGNTEIIRYGRALLLHTRFVDDARGANFAQVPINLEKIENTSIHEITQTSARFD